MRDSENRKASNLVAWQNAEVIAERILTFPCYEDIRHRIGQLFTDGGCSYRKVAEQLRDDPPLNSSRLKHIRTVASAVAIVVRATVNIKKREQCGYDHNITHLEEIKDDALKARRESMKKRGFFVFEPEENEFFWTVALRSQGVRRPNGNFDHLVVAGIMNDRFKNREFTSDICQAKYMMRKGIPKGHECERPKKKHK